MIHPNTTAATALRRSAVALLLLVFVLAQSLGWLHRAVHGAGPVGNGMAATHGAGDGHGDPAHGLLPGLFGGHAEPSDCRLFDALAQPGCAAADVTVPLLALAATVLATAYGDFVARRPAPFDARGPPISR